jgi:hypothetical protein
MEMPEKLMMNVPPGGNGTVRKTVAAVYDRRPKKNRR